MVAAIAYSLNDYVNIFGGTAVQYEDYLLSRHNFLESLSFSNVVRIIDVPFSPSGFNHWLAKNPYWKGSQEARSAWALDIAKDQKKLTMLRAKHFLPGAPVGEETGSDLYFMVIPALVESDEHIKALGSKIPIYLLESIASEIRSFFKAVPEFREKSKLRCEGMGLFIGERIIAPRFAEEVMTYFRTLLDGLLLTGSNIFQLPNDFNTHQLFECLNTKNTVFSPMILPVILHGASSELDYCSSYLEKQEIFIGAASDLICDYVKSEVGVNLLDTQAVFVHSMNLNYCLEFFYKKIEIDKPQVSKKKRNTALKRIK